MLLHRKYLPEKKKWTNKHTKYGNLITMKAKYYGCSSNHLWKVAWGKKEWMFIKDHSSTSSYIHLFQIISCWKRGIAIKGKHTWFLPWTSSKFLFQGGHEIWIFKHSDLQKGLLHVNTLIHSLKHEFHTCGWYWPAHYIGEMPSGCSLHSLRVWVWGLTSACVELPPQQGTSPPLVWGGLQWHFPAGIGTAQYIKVMVLHLLWLGDAAAWVGRMGHQWCPSRNKTLSCIVTTRELLFSTVSLCGQSSIYFSWNIISLLIHLEKAFWFWLFVKKITVNNTIH